MPTDTSDNMEILQGKIVRAVAVNPAGRNLILIGGFRYRFLDNSVRVSSDIDYHWEGDLGEKQHQLVGLFNRSLVPEVRRTLGYDGRAQTAVGPDGDSPGVRVVDLAFWQEGVPNSRIEIPVEVTRIAKVDPTLQATKQGTVYPTVSSQDMIESKIIAILNRQTVKHRDFVDVFLFQSELATDSNARLHRKLLGLSVSDEAVQKRMSYFADHADFHAEAIQTVIDEQLDQAAADNINDAGGGKRILGDVLDLLGKYVSAATGGHEDESL